MPRPFVSARTAPVGALIASILLAACADRGADGEALADSALARDLALVQSAAHVQPLLRDTALTDAPPRVVPTPSAAQPPRPRQVATETRRRERAQPVRRRDAQRPTRVADVPPRQTEERPQPQAAERAGGSAAGVIGAGTVFAATSNARVCMRSNLPGDRITATINAPVQGANGAEIPAGAKVVLEVVSIDADDSAGEGRVAFRVTSVAIGEDSYPAGGAATASGPLERVAGQRSASSDRKKVIGGALAGAILGQMMGKDTRSTVIGAAAGAAAGTAAARMSDNGETCLAAGAPLRITLDEAVVLH
jgi:Glycine zipper 2TM domain